MLLLFVGESGIGDAKEEGFKVQVGGRKESELERHILEATREAAEKRGKTWGGVGAT